MYGMTEQKIGSASSGYYQTSSVLSETFCPKPFHLVRFSPDTRSVSPNVISFHLQSETYCEDAVK